MNRSVLNRRLLRPGSVAPHLGGFSQVSEALVAHWSTQFAGRTVPDLERELYRWAIECKYQCVQVSILTFFVILM